MNRIFTLFIILVALLALAAAKVLLRTNFILGLIIIGGCGVFLAVCWFLYPKFIDNE